MYSYTSLYFPSAFSRLLRELIARLAVVCLKKIGPPLLLLMLIVGATHCSVLAFIVLDFDPTQDWRPTETTRINFVIFNALLLCCHRHGGSEMMLEMYQVSRSRCRSV